MKNIKRNCSHIIYVLGASIIAILVHALLPSPGGTVDVTKFNSTLVEYLGFPFVASTYFVILYIHILMVIRYFAPRATLSKKEIGIRYGLAFGLLYLVGMQEVVVSSSPLETYGLDFVSFQFFMGLGDAIPVLILCLLVSCFDMKQLADKKQSFNYTIKEKVVVLSVITILFFLERVVGYVAGYVDSDIMKYPVPVLVWTLIFGFVLGCMYLLIRPIYTNTNDTKKIIQIMVLSVGINWIWFNCFIGLIIKGTFIKMLLRSGLDVLFITIGALVANYIIKRKQSKS